MSPKDISPSDIQKWTREIVIMLASLAGTGSYTDIVNAREVLAKRKLTPEALFFLRIGLKNEMLSSIVNAKLKEGSYSETGNDHPDNKYWCRATFRQPSRKEWDDLWSDVNKPIPI